MSHTATVSLLKIIFKQLFESSSKLLAAWCTTSYGSSIDTVFDLPIFIGSFFRARAAGRSHMRTTTITDATSDDVKRLTLLADATRRPVAGGGNTGDDRGHGCRGGDSAIRPDCEGPHTRDNSDKRAPGSVGSRSVGPTSASLGPVVQASAGSGPVGPASVSIGPAS